MQPATAEPLLLKSQVPEEAAALSPYAGRIMLMKLLRALTGMIEPSKSSSLKMVFW